MLRPAAQHHIPQPLTILNSCIPFCVIWQHILHVHIYQYNQLLH